MRKLPPNLKREKFKIMVSEAEKNKIFQKAKEYGYRNISEYVREVSLHPNVYKETMHGLKEILNMIGEFNSKLTPVRDNVKELSDRIPIDHKDIEYVAASLKMISKDFVELKNFIATNLKYTYHKEPGGIIKKNTQLKLFD